MMRVEIFNDYNNAVNSTLKKGVCRGVHCGLYVSVNGDFKPCVGFKDVVIGNVLSPDGIDEQIQKSTMMKKLHAASKGDFNSCLKCQHRMFCDPCIAKNYSETGNLFVPSKQQCAWAEAVFEMKNVCRY
jgi:radical SAM protein with 4Fe4S-binding SPASM domain